MSYLSSNFSIRGSFAIIMAMILPFGNITKLIGIEDGFSRVALLLLAFLSLISIIKSHYFGFKRDLLNFVLLIVLSFTVISFAFGLIGTSSLLNWLAKLIILFSIFVYLSRNPEVFDIFLRNYWKVFLFSLLLSLIVYPFYRVPEFIFYDGSAMRFAGFHFELFNLCFSALIFYISWTLDTKKPLLGFILFVMLIALSQSNFAGPYLALFLFSFFFCNALKSRFFILVVTFSILLMPLIIGFFLESLGFLDLLALRKTNNFDLRGSQIYVRLFPYSLAIEQIKLNGIWSLFPQGFGFFESSIIVTGDKENSFGGTGSPKAFVDMGAVCFFLLGVWLSFSSSKTFIQLKSSNLMQFTLLYLGAVAYISFGAGFFNVVAWFCLYGIFLVGRYNGVEKTNMYSGDWR